MLQTVFSFCMYSVFIISCTDRLTLRFSFFVPSAATSISGLKMKSSMSKSHGPAFIFTFVPFIHTCFAMMRPFRFSSFELIHTQPFGAYRTAFIDITEPLMVMSPLSEAINSLEPFAVLMLPALYVTAPVAYMIPCPINSVVLNAASPFI